MNKSPEAFRTISEVADTLDVPPHVLRFWETRFTQVKPVKRGGGRRYYRPEDVRLLRGIRGLLYDDGMTIKGVQKILRERGIRHVIGLGTLPEGEPGPAAEPAGTRALEPVAEPIAEPASAVAPEAPPRPEPPRPARDREETRPSGPQRDLFEPEKAAAAAVAGTLAAAENGPANHARPMDKAALRALLADLQALRQVMTEDPRR